MNPPERSTAPLTPEISSPDPEVVLKRAYDGWYYWRNVDHAELYSNELSVRREAGERSLADAEACFQAVEVALYPEQELRLRDAGRDLLLNYLFLTPEEVNDEKMDRALDLSIEMTRETLDEAWNTDVFKKKHVKLYDLQHLVAFWESMEAEENGDQQRMATARTILGAVVADSAEDIQKLITHYKTVDTGDVIKNKGTKADIQGVAAEFILLTCMRLNVLFSDSVGELQLRSALGHEDQLSGNSRISADMLKQRVHEDKVASRFVQCKSGKMDRRGEYESSVEKVTIDWKAVIKEEEWINFLLTQFVDSTDNKEQVSLVKELNHLLGLYKPKNVTLEELTA